MRMERRSFPRAELSSTGRFRPMRSLTRSLDLSAAIQSCTFTGSAACWQTLFYRLDEKHCALSVARTVDHLSFGSASQEEASHLKLPAKAPVLVIERAAYGIEGRPIEWRRSIGDAKLFKFKH